MLKPGKGSVTGSCPAAAPSESGSHKRAPGPSDKRSGRSKGMGILEYGTREEAEEAIRTLNDTELDGRQIAVREDRDAPAREGGGGGDGGDRGGRGRGRGGRGEGGGDRGGRGGGGRGRGGREREPKKARASRVIAHCAVCGLCSKLDWLRTHRMRTPWMQRWKHT